MKHFLALIRTAFQSLGRGYAAGRITFCYALLGGLWIVLSDHVLAFVVGDEAAYHQLQTFKGWFFVAVTAALVYLLVRSLERQLHELLATLNERNEKLEAEVQQRRQAERERAHLNAALSRMNQELEGIIYATSHDLREPLINIEGFTKELGSEVAQLNDWLGQGHVDAMTSERIRPIMEEMIPAQVHHISDNVSKMGSLVRAVLQLSWLGRMVTDLEKIDMRALIDNLIEVRKGIVGKRGVEIEIGDLAPCVGDEKQLKIALGNVLDNALRYLDSERPGRVSISCQVEDEHVVYRIADNGVGIESRHLERVFNMFYRVEGHRDGRCEGVGLTIARRVITRLHGRIWATSTPGVGTTVFIELPRQIWSVDGSAYQADGKSSARAMF